MLVAGPLDSVTQLTTITSGALMGPRIRTFSATVFPNSAAWPAANDAYLIPFEIGFPVYVKEIFFISGTTPGTANFDLGIYDDKFARIVSLGATAATNTTDALQPAGGGDIADVALAAGRYYMAMSAAATTITARAAVNANGFLRALGMFKMAAAHPLPATITAASMGTTAFMPTIGISTVTNLL